MSKQEVTRRVNAPQANVLMKSMRSMGYSFEAAVADIIDNSIAAGAKTVKVLMPCSPYETSMAILDDGKGMSDAEMFEAMKYGSKEGERDEYDLGRFGLGLKSASLSICRSLTVVSKQNDTYVAMRWDLDVVESTKEWTMDVLSDNQITELPYIDRLEELSHGTLVIWSKFDTIDQTRGSLYTCLSMYMDPLSKYLSLIFHRYMSASGKDRVSIWINACKLTPLDPFLENHNKTTYNVPIDIPIKDKDGIERIVKAQTFTLPHVHDITPDDAKLLGGIENLRTQQGFYVYRNMRLIIWGKWFGMHKEELFKYARIKVDIPNTLDDIWHIDIKKQNATIPQRVQDRLKDAVLKVKNQSQIKHDFRGSKKKSEVRLWYPSTHHGVTEFRINRDASIFGLLDKFDDKVKNTVTWIVDEIEKNIPYYDIHNAMAHNSIQDVKEPDDKRKKEMRMLASALMQIEAPLGSKTIKLQALERIFATEPLCDFKDLFEEMKKEL